MKTKKDITKNECELKKLSTKDLLALNIGEKYTKEEICNEVVMRMHYSEDESEIQKLWKFFKEIN